MTPIAPLPHMRSDAGADGHATAAHGARNSLPHCGFEAFDVLLRPRVQHELDERSLLALLVGERIGHEARRPTSAVRFLDHPHLTLAVEAHDRPDAKRRGGNRLESGRPSAFDQVGERSWDKLYLDEVPEGEDFGNCLVDGASGLGDRRRLEHQRSLRN